MSIGTKCDRLPVDKGALHGQAPDRLRNLRQSVGEVRAVAGPKGRAVLFLASDDPIAVVLDLVQPVRAGGRMVDEDWLAGTDEAGRRAAPGTRRRGTPQHLRSCSGRKPEVERG